jgi:hypothetical protein
MKLDRWVLAAALAALAATAACSSARTATPEWQHRDMALQQEVVVTAQRPERAVDEVVVAAVGPFLKLSETVVMAERGPVEVSAYGRHAGQVN